MNKKARSQYFLALLTASFFIATTVKTVVVDQDISGRKESYNATEKNQIAQTAVLGFSCTAMGISGAVLAYRGIQENNGKKMLGGTLLSGLGIASFWSLSNRIWSRSGN